jgi:hypothetical protein
MSFINFLALFIFQSCFKKRIRAQQAKYKIISFIITKEKMQLGKNASERWK